MIEVMAGEWMAKAGYSLEGGKRLGALARAGIWRLRKKAYQMLKPTEAAKDIWVSFDRERAV